MTAVPVPDEHKIYRQTEFKPDVCLDEYSEDEKIILRKYGSWLKALMQGKITPTTDEQRYFLQMCFGEVHPNTDIQRTWKKYQLDVMYKVAIGIYADGKCVHATRWDAVSRFRELAKQRHQAALIWLEKERELVDIPETAPLINIARIYPNSFAAYPHSRGGVDLLDSGLVYPGSYGSKTGG